jgi:hypothetical protein
VGRIMNSCLTFEFSNPNRSTREGEGKGQQEGRKGTQVDTQGREEGRRGETENQRNRCG